MVGPNLSLGRKPTSVVEAGLHSFLDQFHHRLIFPLYPVQRSARTSVQLGFIPHIADKAYARYIVSQRLDDVNGEAPGIEIKHEVRKEPIVVGADGLAVVGGGLGQIENVVPSLAGGKLEVSVLEEFVGIVFVVDDGVEVGVNERDVEAFQVVVTVERPVCLDEIIASSFLGKAEFVEGEPVQAFQHRPHPILETSGRINRGEEEGPPPGVRDFGQVVGFGRKPDDLFKLRHVLESSIEPEAAAVVSAAQKPLIADALADLHASVGADVAEQVGLVVGISGQDQRFIETTLEKGEGIDGAGDLGHVLVGDPLPALGKDGFLAPLEPGRILVKGGGEGGRVLDSRVNVELGHASF